MPNLINTDNAGNVFYNYITPVTKGETKNAGTFLFLDDFLSTKLGNKGLSWNSYQTYYNIRFPAPEFELKTGNITSTTTTPDGNARAFFSTNSRPASVNSSNTASSSYNSIGVLSPTNIPQSATDVSFAVINDYSLVYCCFTDPSFSSLMKFFYLGFTREPVFTGTSTGVLGLTVICNQSSDAFNLRPQSANSTTSVTLASAADSITSPPIICTTGTDPGDGSETFTDIVIRDAASPNNPVGKLWNCIDMPATCNVGELWRNTGAYDGDASASEQDVYLCIMPWGERKLGMRVWTENIT